MCSANATQRQPLELQILRGSIKKTCSCLLLNSYEIQLGKDWMISEGGHDRSEVGSWDLYVGVVSLSIGRVKYSIHF